LLHIVLPFNRLLDAYSPLQSESPMSGTYWGRMGSHT